MEENTAEPPECKDVEALNQRVLSHITFSTPYSLDQVIDLMKTCQQAKCQTVYEHGLSVWAHLQDLVRYLRTQAEATELSNAAEPMQPASLEILSGWKLPLWFHAYTAHLYAHLYEPNLLEEYAIHHDCGKPYCATESQHFPDHANVSRFIWQTIGGSPIVAHLMYHDMDIHVLSATEIAKRLTNDWTVSDAITLLLAALAEIHSNAEMFGGQDSLSFRIKWKRVSSRGMQICRALFDGQGTTLPKQ